MYHLRPIAVCGAFLLAIVGPFSAPSANAQGAQPSAPSPGKALVYIIRSDPEPRDALVPLVVNAEMIGYFENGSFTTAEVRPGKVFIRTGDQVVTSFTFEAASGGTYYVRVRAISGTSKVQTNIDLLNDAQGRSAIAQGRFAPPAQAAPQAARAPSRPAAPAPNASAAAPSYAAAGNASNAPAVGAADSSETQNRFYIRADLGFSKTTNVDIKDENFAATQIICGDAACNTPGKLKDIGGGYLISAAGGYRFSPHVRGEVALALRSYTMKVSDAASTQFKSDVTSLSAMANVFYDFATSGVTPYVGAGVGIAQNFVDNLVLTSSTGSTLTVTESGTASGIATAVMFGVGIPLSRRAVFDIGYRYSMLGKLNLDTGPSASGKLNAHEITVGLRF